MAKKIFQKFGLYQKLGMTRIFNDKGRYISATVLKLEPSKVYQTAKDYLMLAYSPKRKNIRSMQKQIKLANTKFSKIRKIYINSHNFKPGDDIIIKFKIGSRITAQSISKGKGFQGVIKRHGFSRGPETHGSNHHRAPGSIGSMFPQRVIKGKKMPGQMGKNKTTIKNLTVIDVDKTNNLLIVGGSIAGPNKTRVLIYQ